MRHAKRLKKLGLGRNHRESLLKNLVASLILHGRIKTTESRAKALASRFARLMRLVKTRNKREAIRMMPKHCSVKAASHKLINEFLGKYKDRTSGFTRITRIGVRTGDNAKRVQIELLNL